MLGGTALCDFTQTSVKNWSQFTEVKENSQKESPNPVNVTYPTEDDKNLHKMSRPDSNPLSIDNAEIGPRPEYPQTIVDKSVPQLLKSLLVYLIVCLSVGKYFHISPHPPLFSSAMEL